jgi:hypothetical protein
MSESKIVPVDRNVLEAILDTARDGEAQVVEFSKDNSVMAARAAALSKRKCAEISEIISLILTGQPVVLSTRDDENDDE